MAGNGPSVDYGHGFPAVPEDGMEGPAQKTTDKRPEPKLPIFSILDSIEFSEHFVIIGDVGTGKSTITPIHEYELCKRNRQIVIREPSRAARNALFYSLQALHPELGDAMAVITKDTKSEDRWQVCLVSEQNVIPSYWPSIALSFIGLRRRRCDDESGLSLMGDKSES